MPLTDLKSMLDISKPMPDISKSFVILIPVNNYDGEKITKELIAVQGNDWYITGVFKR